MSAADATVAHPFDAIVVGAGAAGCVAARELTLAGLRVLLLEAGPAIEPSRHFPEPPPRSFGMLDRALLAVDGQPVQARCFACTRATRQLYVNDRDNPYSTPPGKPFNWFRGRQVGGRLHTWGRVVPRFSDWELKPGTRGMAGIDWPIGYDDLEPFYSRVERLLGVHGTREGVPQRPDGEYIAARPLTPAEERVRDLVSRRWPTRRFAPAPVVKHHPEHTPLPLLGALQTGNLTLRSDAVVRRVQLDTISGKARGVEFVDRVGRRVYEARGRIVVLCASAIESVRILLNSASDAHPQGVGNSSGMLGRFLMDHCMVALAGEVPDPWTAGASHATATLADPYDMASAFVYLPGFRNISEPPPSPYAGSFSMLGSIGRPDRGFFLLGFGDMQPLADNRVRLDARRRDAWGVPVAHIECAHSANDQALVADMAATMRELAQEAGLRLRPVLGDRTSLKGRAAYAAVWKHVVTPSGAFHPGGAIHELGGARMGDDPKASVLNRHNQCWDVPNLFVTDGACFVSSGHQSHTLTIMALTIRACDLAAAQLRSGGL